MKENLENILDNPKPKPGQTRADFISYCIPIVHKEHPKWSMKKVKAVCYSIWRRHHKNDDTEFIGFTENGDEIIKFTDDAIYLSSPIPLSVTPSGTNDKNDDLPNPNKKHMIAVIGDRFMAGGWLSAEVLQKDYKDWENSLHDLNHMGTSTGFFLIQSDISYFVGWHSNVQYDKKTKSVSMDLNIEPEVPRSVEWKGYIKLCENANRIPNVSVTYYGTRKYIPAKDLPKEADWKKEGYGKEDLVPVLTEIKPFCVSTVLRGRCDDKGGCGIKNTSCECDSCKVEDTQALNDLMQRVKAKEQKLKEE